MRLTVIGGALALGLDEDREVLGVLSVPRFERLEELETVRLGVDDDVDRGTVGGGSGVGVLTSIVSTGREFLARRVRELELFAVGTLERVGHGVEGEGSTKDHGGDEIGRGDESVGGSVGVVTTGEVSVVRGDDRVLGTLGDVLSVPLSDTRSTGVRENGSSDSLELLHLSVTGNRGTNLLGSGGDGETRLGLESVRGSLLGDRSGARHVLVRRVGARSDETDRELVGPVVLLDGGGKLGEGSREIRSVGTVDVGFEFREVDLDDLVVLGVLVGAEVVLESLGVRTDVGTVGRVEVLTHATVVGEERGGCTDFGTHVADGGHSSARERVDTLSEIFDDGSRSSLDGKDTSDLEDDICESISLVGFPQRFRV